MPRWSAEGRNGAHGRPIAEGTLGTARPGTARRDPRALLEPFHTTNPTGWGWLWITRGIVQDHEGTIKLRSQAGKGATWVSGCREATGPWLTRDGGRFHPRHTAGHRATGDVPARTVARFLLQPPWRRRTPSRERASCGGLRLWSRHRGVERADRVGRPPRHDDDPRRAGREVHGSRAGRSGRERPSRRGGSTR